MIADLSDSILTPANILWLISAVIAATLLFGSINRRRSKLTNTLKAYVDRNATDIRSPSDGAKNKPNSNDD
jgi:hypothetical protein